MICIFKVYINVIAWVSILNIGILITEASAPLNEPSWAVLSLYSWFNEWMSFFLAQHLAK